MANDVKETVLENGKVVNETASNETKATGVTNVMSMQDTIKRILADGNSKIVNTIITNITCEVRKSNDGASDYMNAWLTVQTPLIGARPMPDGSHVMGTLGSFQMPFNMLLLSLRKDTFFGRYAKYIEEAAEVDAAGLYIAGLEVQILCQFVAAGEQSKNPFTRKENFYEVEQYDRYIYHVVGIGECKDPITIDNYTELNKQIAADARAAIMAKRNAASAVAGLRQRATAATTTPEMPF